jgi:hypothetical protein
VVIGMFMAHFKNKKRVMRILLVLSLIFLYHYNSFAQEFIMWAPPQEIIDLKIGRYDSILITNSIDSTEIGKKFIDEETLHLNVDEFISLFKDTNQIVTYSLDINDDKNEIIYSYHLPLFNYLRISKNDISNYSIYESYMFDIVYGKNETEIKAKEVLKYDMYISKNRIEIKMDKGFYKNRFKIDKSFKSLIEEYNLYKSDKTYTSKDWDELSDSKIKKLEQLSVNLTLAVLNGCEECSKIIDNFRKTFDIMNCGMISEKFGHCESLLYKIKNAP